MNLSTIDDLRLCGQREFVNTGVQLWHSSLFMPCALNTVPHDDTHYLE